MNPLATLRRIAILLVLALCAASASAADGGKKPRKPQHTGAVERTVKPQRKEVAAFVDPTLPLTELVERVRTERIR